MLIQSNFDELINNFNNDVVQYFSHAELLNSGSFGLMIKLLIKHDDEYIFKDILETEM